MRNFIGILFFFAAGFSILGVSLIPFFEFERGVYYPVVYTLCTFSLIFYLIGLAFYRGENWKTSTGLILIIVGGFDLFSGLMVISIKSSPEVMKLMSEMSADMTGFNAFNNYTLGFIVSFVLIGFGAFSYILGDRADKSKQLQR